MTQSGNTARAALFDGYAENYRDVINRSIRWSGEEYEYFIDLRIRMMSKRLQKYCFRTVPRPRTVLDFGCGMGAAAPFLRKNMPDAVLSGVDISGASIRVARERNAGAMAFESYDGKTLPYPDKTYDVIYMNGVMHHIPVPERHDVFRELWRVMAPGCFMFIFENNPWNPLMVQAMRKNPFDNGAEAIKLSDLAITAKDAGFQVVESWYYCFFPRFLKFMRLLEPKLGRFPFGAQYGLWVVK